MTKTHCSLNILEVCTVPPSPGSAVPASLPLTFFDILWLRFPPVKVIYFYKSPASFDMVVSNLKTSLPVVLQHYLPLAGAIVWPENAPKPSVETVLGDGVSLSIAESNSNFHDLVNDGLREATEFHPLVRELPADENRAAVVALQVTSFGSDGFCIGITSHHAVVDGKSATSFVKSWARVCKSLVAGDKSWERAFPTAEMMPFYDRSVVADPLGLEGIYLRDWLAVGGPNNKSLKFWSPTIPHNVFRGTFKLNPENIQKLKQFVLNRRNPTQPTAHISTFTVAMAYTWVCTAMADNSVPNCEMVYGMLADVRHRLNPPLPTNYFGNCLVGRTIAVERAKLVAKDSVITAVESISKVMLATIYPTQDPPHRYDTVHLSTVLMTLFLGISQKDSCRWRLWSSHLYHNLMIKSLEHEEALEDAEKKVKILTQVRDSNQKFLSTAGSSRFEMYGMDFGWGTPEKVEVVSIDGTGAVCICDGRDDGVELAWAAKKGVMETFGAIFAKGLEEL